MLENWIWIQIYATLQNFVQKWLVKIFHQHRQGHRLHLGYREPFRNPVSIFSNCHENYSNLTKFGYEIDVSSKWKCNLSVRHDHLRAARQPGERNKPFLHPSFVFKSAGIFWLANAIYVLSIWNATQNFNSWFECIKIIMTLIVKILKFKCESTKN